MVKKTKKTSHKKKQAVRKSKQSAKRKVQKKIPRNSIGLRVITHKQLDNPTTYDKHGMYFRTKLIAEEGKVFQKQYKLDGDGYEGVKGYIPKLQYVETNYVRTEDDRIAFYTDLFTSNRTCWVHGTPLTKVWKEGELCWRRKEDGTNLRTGDFEAASIIRDKYIPTLYLDLDDVHVLDTNEVAIDPITSGAAFLKEAHRIGCQIVTGDKDANLRALMIKSQSYGLSDKSGVRRAKIHIEFELTEPMLLSTQQTWAKAYQADEDLRQKEAEHPHRQIDPSIYTSNQGLWLTIPKLPKSKKLGRVASLIKEMERVTVEGKKKNFLSPALLEQVILDNGGEIGGIQSHTRDDLPDIDPEEHQNLKDIVTYFEKHPEIVFVNREGKTVKQKIIKNVKKVHNSEDLNKVFCMCPNHKNHTLPDGDTSTYMIANGKRIKFWCSHGGCLDVYHKKHWYGMLQYDFGMPHKLNWTLASNDFVQYPEKNLLKRVKQTANPSIHKSKWTIDDIQNNYIYIEAVDAVYSKYSRRIVSPKTVNTMHEKVWESVEAKHAGGKYLKGMGALMLSTKKHGGGVIVVAEQFNPKTTDLVTNIDGLDYLNQFKGYRLKEGKKGNVKAFHEHMAVICPNPKEASAFTDYLAHVIQKPWERPTWAVVHVSVPQGLGRGLLNTLMENILRPYYSNPPAMKVMGGEQFNEFLYNKLWIGVDETDYKNNKRAKSTLKEIITAVNVDINMKNKTILQGYPIFARFFFMTNEVDALPIEESDRRYWVIGPTEPGYMPREQEYYDGFLEQVYNKKFQEAVLYYLMNRDISKFTPGRIPFSTSLRKEMQQARRTPVEKAITRIRECGYFPPFMTVEHLEKLILEHLRHHNAGASATEITKVLRTLPPYGEQIRYGPKSKPYRFRIISNIRKHKEMTKNEVKEELNKYTKAVPLDWAKED